MTKTTIEQVNSIMTQAVHQLEGLGFDIAFVLAHYSEVEGDTHFSSRISVTEKPDLGITVDHFYGDVTRELANNWSTIAHKK